MATKGFKPEQIFHLLREGKIRLVSASIVGEVCRALSFSEQSDYRWRKEYGSMQVSHAKKRKHLERENTRLKKPVTDQAIEKAILEEALKGQQDQKGESTRVKNNGALTLTLAPVVGAGQTVLYDSLLALDRRNDFL
ncbi:hypothetical protein E2F43_12060 [Seongchinamella unica]|uniref:Transposase n=1 Tax=Seongchinamella unica TaxID=2547392 RepID=A0A4R5LTG1_9GAMM|nr:transposase [Seongchinamella unica]TDG14200.1 hypothetical protein E2F43_12060 [Seongchinamella unica]